MLEKKELRQEELEKVSGGLPPFKKVYKSYIDIKIFFLNENNVPDEKMVTFEVLSGRTENDNLNDATSWCQQHNYTYQRYEVLGTYSVNE